VEEWHINKFYEITKRYRMSTTFGIRINGEEREVARRRGVGRGMVEIIWLDELAKMLPIDTKVEALDNSPQGIYTIGDLQHYDYRYNGLCHQVKLKDSVVESLIKKYKERSEVGIKKYGTTLDREDLNTSDWLKHLQEELMDASLYIEKLLKEKK
jgi:hypothetical protein